MTTAYSPVLGLITAAFELTAAVWISRLEGRKPVQRLVMALLILLAGYQLLEVLICWNDDFSSTSPRVLLLSRAAFLDITWLPPLGLLLISRVYPTNGKALRRYARITLALAGMMSLWIVLDYRFLTGTICQFLFSKYLYAEPYFHIYGAFYEITQLSMLVIPAVLLVRVQDRFVRAQLGDLLLGALSYLIPSLFLAAVKPEIFNLGLPSLMCHFAVFYAVFLIRLSLRESRHAGVPPNR